jgi:Acetyltransferase (GNAT) family
LGYSKRLPEQEVGLNNRLEKDLYLLATFASLVLSARFVMRHPEATDHQVMLYLLVPAMPEDKGWLEQLRRSFYQELFFATWGCWDEARHLRHCAECWERGGIFCLEVEGVRVGMIQLFENPDTIEVGEIQIEPNHQNQKIGSLVLRGYGCASPWAA